jgi:hypothetical protein
MDLNYIEKQLIRLCLQPRTFEFITTKMHGLYPVKINETLIDLQKRGKLKFDDPYWVAKDIHKSHNINIKEHEPYLKKYMGHFNFLKIPHPLDYEWRNTPKSLDFITDLLLKKLEVNDSITIMGMPTLFRSLCLRDVPQKVTLVEKNKPIIDALNELIRGDKTRSIEELDIFKAKPNLLEKSQCVVMDPPWYDEYFKQFVWLAAQLLETGGMLIISIPPINTRSNILEERNNWINFCKDQGLCIEELMPEALEYAMPFFEFNSLNAAGVSNLLPFWRKGDLAMFRKHNENSSLRPKVRINEEKWVEIEIDSIRIRVKIDESNLVNSDNLEIENLVEGNGILPTLSTNDSRRKKANIWTSGNRIYSVNNVQLALKFLNEFKNCGNIKNVKNPLTELILYLSKVEKKEYYEYLNWIYYEMERVSY